MAKPHVSGRRSGVVVLAAVACLLVLLVSSAQARGRYCGAQRGTGLGIVAYGPTSCPFARNTAKAWLRHGQPRSRWLRVYSPTTHRHYRMHCRTWHGHGDGNGYEHGLCTGGKHAHVDLLS